MATSTVENYIKQIYLLQDPASARSLVGMGELERNPTIKEEIEAAGLMTVNAAMYRFTSASECCTEIVHCSSSPGVMKMPRFTMNGYEAQ